MLPNACSDFQIFVWEAFNLECRFEVLFTGRSKKPLEEGGHKSCIFWIRPSISENYTVEACEFRQKSHNTDAAATLGNLVGITSNMDAVSRLWGRTEDCDIFLARTPSSRYVRCMEKLHAICSSQRRILLK